MGALAQTSTSTISVEPGQSSSITIEVHNNGTVVDRFWFKALGPAAPCVSFSPESLSLFPDTSGTVTVTFSPPRRSTTPSGGITVGIQVASSEDPNGSVVEEVGLLVGAFSDISTELIPRILSGRLTGKAKLAVDNRSNCPYRADLYGSDSKSALHFSFSPAAIDVAPGHAVFVKVAIRPIRRFWRGTPKTHPLRVILRNHDTTANSTHGSMPRVDGPPPSTAPLRPHKEEIFVEGSMVQDPMLPRWVLALIGLLGLLALLWFLLLKPQIRSTARDEVSSQLAAAGITTTTNATTNAASPPKPANAAPNEPTPGPPSVALTSGPTVNGQLVATGNGTKTYVVPQGKTLAITDLLVENASGDVGNLVLSRDSVVLMMFAMADFRDLDYHWITPTFFGPSTKLSITVSGCTGTCNPAIYYAGYLSSTS